MVDVVDAATRSRMMSGIRGRNTRPELLVRSFLHRAGLRFRLHVRLPGKPDLVFPKYRTVVFVHGCFWHRHAGCRLASIPATNRRFWEEKFEANVARDRRITRQLRREGWHVLVAWECEDSAASLNTLLRRILANRGS
ncbi:MAG: DNA mismatch endonuclease Vsr [Proteobacteria bacterium]|nr:DNA mismatch endonuclease Vsr [Pseudomonadota bacterium]MBS0463990.1 DNA mismatch endonuclease Vsr [Pseudomonadota bacterium]